MERIAYIGIDVHKDTNSCCLFYRDFKGNPSLYDMGNMFLFCSKNRRTLAVLVWDNGFWLMKKKFYSGTFAWPGDSTQALTITVDDVRRVIRGDDVFRRIPMLPDGLKI